MSTQTLAKPVKTETPRALPVPNADFYHLTDTLDEKEKQILGNVRDFMKTKVAPVINKYWL